IFKKNQTHRRPRTALLNHIFTEGPALVFPNAAHRTPTMSGVGENESGTYREYVIKKGDTLTAISMLFYQNRSMIQEICELNHIENADNIVAGQKILLP
ncbi:MAG: LysM peptidoglycan-binding domain-containing protein, partial [Lachnospiraceae bacterium]|nr:LysM peptidoglycan-binding domain-containing protein [Lachnospiraceae bacterium]